jgi:hypothetical protein
MVDHVLYNILTSKMMSPQAALLLLVGISATGKSHVYNTLTYAIWQKSSTK